MNPDIHSFIYLSICTGTRLSQELPECWKRNICQPCVCYCETVCMRVCLAGGVAHPGLDHQSENLASRSAPYNLPCTSKTWFVQSCKESCFKVTKATYTERNSMRQLPSLRGKRHLLTTEYKSSSD